MHSSQCACGVQAYAAFKFAESCIAAMKGQAIVECAYVASELTRVPFFASPVRLGPHGIKEILPLPTRSSAEQKWLDDMLDELQGSVDKGVAFARS